VVGRGRAGEAAAVCFRAETRLPNAPTSRAARKETARRAVEAFDRSALEAWASAEPGAFWLLQPLLFSADPQLSWRTVEAVGRVAAHRASGALEPVREMVRHTLWLMTDESGGLLWQGPPVLGAVLANAPALCGEFLAILESFLEEEPFRAGTRWALWRVAGARPEAVARGGRALAASLADADPAVRGHAALALAAACGREATAALAGDQAPLTVFDYRTGALRPTTVGAIAGGGF
jgi:HEAT repeat protein